MDGWKANNSYNEVSIRTDESGNVRESKDSRRFIGHYILNPVLSEIDSSRVLPDTRLWIEKNAYSYFQKNENWQDIHIGDTVQNDFIIHINKMLRQSPDPETIDDQKYLRASWQDKSTSEVLAKTGDNWIHIISKCPDTLLVSMSGYEFVYKGKICIVKEY